MLIVKYSEYRLTLSFEETAGVTEASCVNILALLQAETEKILEMQCIEWSACLQATTRTVLIEFMGSARFRDFHGLLDDEATVFGALDPCL